MDHRIRRIHIHANDFGNKDNEHCIYKIYLRTIYNDPNLLMSHDSESQQKSAKVSRRGFKKF